MYNKISKRRVIFAISVIGSVSLHIAILSQLEKFSDHSHSKSTIADENSTPKKKLIFLRLVKSIESSSKPFFGTATDVNKDSSSESMAPAIHQPVAPLKVTKEPVLLTEDFNHIEADDGVSPVGHVIINISIDESGHVNYYKILESTVVSRIEQQLISQINDSKWAPAEFNGIPVAYSFDIRIDLAP